MNDGRSNTLIMDVPGSAPAPSGAGSIAAPDSDIDDPDTSVRPPADGQHPEPEPMARPQAARLASGPGTLVAPPPEPVDRASPSASETPNAGEPVAHEPFDPAPTAAVAITPAGAGREMVSSVPIDLSAPAAPRASPSGPSEPSFGAPAWIQPTSDTPLAISQGPGTSAGPVLRGMSPAARKTSLNPFAIGALLGLATVVVVGGGAALYVLSAEHPTPVGSSAPTANASSAPSSPSSGASPAASLAPPDGATASAETAPAGPDAEARAALERLRDGIGSCVKNTIRILPGTSEAVPDAIAWLKHGPYVSSLHDWVGPFWSCTGFKLQTPMPFMIQWQLEKPGDHGQAIAWVDADHDGTAERAYGFTARLQEHGVVEFGPIGPVDPSQKIAKR